MNHFCRVCELKYEPELGHCLGAMNFNYPHAILAGLPTAVVLFIARLPVALIASILALQLLLMSRLIYRYSFALWLHMDLLIEPHY